MTRRGLLWLTVGGVLVAAAGAAGGYLWDDGSSGQAGTVITTPSATAPVERGDLAATETWEGTLGHGDPLTITATSDGVITRVAEQGTRLKRGATLYRLDEEPVTLLYGSIPMYRDLVPGDCGVDVDQLETNLAKLGYDGFTVDDEYTWYTELAVREWQEDIGAEETGTVPRSSVVFLPEPGRVDTVPAAVGATVTPGAPILDITGDEQVASLEADVSDRDLFGVGTQVQIALPGGEQVAGTVESTAVAAAESASAPDDATGADNTVAHVEIALAEPVADDLIGAPVDIVVEIDQRTGVLVVPVSALLALAEGGYGLEVVADDGTTSIVAVDTGLFADGKVEVSGDIAPGTVVGTAGR